MKKSSIIAVLVCLFLTATQSARAQQKTNGPANAKAQKSYATGMKWLQAHNYGAALDSFRKADKQDGGHCLMCQEQVVKLGLQMRDYKAATAAAQEMIAEAPASQKPAVALAHYELAGVLLRQADDKHKADLYSEADQQCKAAIAAYGDFPMPSMPTGSPWLISSMMKRRGCSFSIMSP